MKFNKRFALWAVALLAACAPNTPTVVPTAVPTAVSTIAPTNPAPAVPTQVAVLTSPLPTPVLATAQPAPPATAAPTPAARPTVFEFKPLDEIKRATPRRSFNALYNSSASGVSRIVRKDGDNPERILTPAGAGAEPRFSPDRSRIAYTATGDGNTFDVYVMDADGGRPRALLDAPHRLNWWPDWSPDGKQILFVSNLGGTAQIYIVAVDGANRAPPRQISAGAGNNYQPSWSPNGKWIAFTSDRNNGNADIFIMAPDGTGERQVTGVKGVDDGGIDYDDLAPSWSPDSSVLALYSKRDSNAEIYLVRLDGSGLRRVTTTLDIDERMPRWLDASTVMSAITRSNTKGVALIDVNTGGYFESGADAARRVDTVDGYR